MQQIASRTPSSTLYDYTLQHMLTDSVRPGRQNNLTPSAVADPGLQGKCDKTPATGHDLETTMNSRRGRLRQRMA